MTDRHRVYTKVKKTLKRMMKLSHRGQDVTLAMMISGIVLSRNAPLPLVPVMDGSQAGRGCMVLMVGVLYQKRALPIAWLVYKGKKGHTSAERHKQILEFEMIRWQYKTLTYAWLRQLWVARVERSVTAYWKSFDRSNVHVFP